MFDKLAENCSDVSSVVRQNTFYLLGDEFENDEIRSCNDLNDQQRNLLRVCENSSSRKAYLLQSELPTESQPILVWNSREVKIYEVPISFVVIGNNIAFLRTTATIWKLSLGKPGEPRTFNESVMWSRAIGVCSSRVIGIGGGAAELSIFNDRIYALSDRTLYSFPHSSCDLYESCKEVVQANLAGDPLDCVWCVEGFYTSGRSVSSSDNRLSTCLRKVRKDKAGCTEKTQTVVIIFVNVLGVLALVASGLLVRHLARPRQRCIKTIADEIARKTKDNYLISDVDGSRISYPDLPQLVPEEALIPLARIAEGPFLGEGNFGVLFKAMLDLRADGESILLVAVKTLQADARISHLLHEGLRMRCFDHPRVLRLIGISFHKWVPLLVTPFMANGDLACYLRNKENLAIDQRRLLEFGLQIAEGVDYLHSQNFVHRDLACRNCMLDDNLNIKIGDFGLSRNVEQAGTYIASQLDSIPVRWTAPEGLHERSLFTKKSDTWSFGVVLWELMTRCEEPYSKVCPEDGESFNSQIVKDIQAGFRLPQTRFCPRALYEVMHLCWAFEPEDRPNIGYLRQLLTDILSCCRDERPSDDEKALFCNEIVPCCESFHIQEV